MSEEDELFSGMSSPNSSVPFEMLQADGAPTSAAEMNETTTTTATSNNSGANSNNAAERKKLFLKNPWGNASYAELIAKAIKNSTRGSLTLSEIYDWYEEENRGKIGTILGSSKISRISSREGMWRIRRRGRTRFATTFRCTSANSTKKPVMGAGNGNRHSGSCIRKSWPTRLSLTREQVRVTEAEG